MQFELSHEDIQAALQEYVKKKGIYSPISFTIKTSRKGERKSRAYITMLDSEPTATSTNVEPFRPVVVAQEEMEETKEENNKEITQEESPVFKKLFA